MTHRRLTIPLLSALAAALPLSSCDDLETDKISEEVSVRINPGLLLPLAAADVSVEYLFDEVGNAVEYYSDDGERKVRLHAEHAGLWRRSVLGLLGLDGEGYSFPMSAIPLSAYVGAAAAEAGAQGEETVEVPVPFSLDVASLVAQADTSVAVSGLEVRRLVCPVSLEVSWSRFGAPVELEVSFAGVRQTLTASGSGSGVVGSESGVVEVVDGKVSGEVVARVPASAVGSVGSLLLRMSTGAVKELTCAVGSLRLRTDSYFSLTGMESFRRVGGELQWRDPRLWLLCSDDTPMDIVYTPELKGVGGYSEGAGPVLSTKARNVAAREKAEHEYNSGNSNFMALLNRVPDEIEFGSWVDFRMPSGAEEVTLVPTDTLSLGYRYLVPFDFMINAEMDPDTIDLHDVPDLEFAKRARLFLTAVNSMPMEGSFSLTLYDRGSDTEKSQVAIGTVMGLPTVEKSSGLSTDSAQVSKTVELSHQACEDLGHSDAVIIRISLDTKGQYVSPTLDDHMRLNMSLGLDIDYEVKN